MPAVGIRGNPDPLRCVDQLALDTGGLDGSISKGSAFITPCAGLRRVWVDSDPKNVPALQ